MISLTAKVAGNSGGRLQKKSEGLEDLKQACMTDTPYGTLWESEMHRVQSHGRPTS